MTTPPTDLESKLRALHGDPCPDCRAAKNGMCGWYEDSVDAAAIGAELAFEEAASMAQQCFDAEDWWLDKLPDAIRARAKEVACGER